MLDQNTDRMWYVIGAIVIGAAIIAMGLNIFSESFNSVDEMMTSLTGIASDNVTSIGKSGIYTDEEIDNLINNEGYIPVATADELDRIRKSDMQTFGVGTKWEGGYDTSGLSDKYILVNSINLSKVNNFTPIGNVLNPSDVDRSAMSFRGVFDGGGYIIENLTVDKGSNAYAGLFGRLESAVVMNTALVNVNIKAQEFAGGLTGAQTSSSEIIDCYITGRVSGSNYIGGLTGEQWGSSTITNTHTKVNVSGFGNLVGGFIGQSLDSYVYDSGWISDNFDDSLGIGNNIGSSVVLKKYTLSEINDIIYSLFK